MVCWFPCSGLHLSIVTPKLAYFSVNCPKSSSREHPAIIFVKYKNHVYGFTVFANLPGIFVQYCCLMIPSMRFTFARHSDLLGFFGFWLFCVAVLQGPSYENLQWVSWALMGAKMLLELSPTSVPMTLRAFVGHPISYHRRHIHNLKKKISQITQKNILRTLDT